MFDQDAPSERLKEGFGVVKAGQVILHAAPPLQRRRTIFASLVAVTLIASIIAMVMILTTNGFTLFDLAILICFALTLPWNVIGLWNAIIGLAIRLFARDPVAFVDRNLRVQDEDAAITSRTAVIVPVYNEDPEMVFRHFRTTAESIDATGEGDRFDYFVLSDTNDPEIAREEERLFLEWRRLAPRANQIHYRRRSENVGQKAGNVWEFVERRSEPFDQALILDADSLMTGDAVLRLVRLMQENPRLGILQSLVVGLPASSAFARIFQFGMRHGMRAYTTGSAWWQGNAGPYWGHNALLRLDVFREHCRLPSLPGEAPFGGRILSHDQVEAALVRRAGYDVAVIPEETGSFELNPPHLLEFVRRDLRWCQGNLQYLNLLSHVRFHAMGQVQLALAVMMYVSGPAWLAFMAVALAQGGVFGLLGSVGPSTGSVPLPWDMDVTTFGIGMLITMVGMTLAPKIAGMIDVLVHARSRERYGGGLAIFGSGLIEFLLSMLVSPVIAMAQALFIIGLFRGKTISWNAQIRSDQALPWAVVASRLWPQTLVGLSLGTSLYFLAPSILPWTAPVIIGLGLSIPIARWTSIPAFGRWMRDRAVCAIPEEYAPVPEVAAAGYRHLVGGPLTGAVEPTGTPTPAPSRINIR
ncbi:MAG: glucans biosynthesis glucosyltransferase MdoH [Geminicoccaceae bacterium]